MNESSDVGHAGQQLSLAAGRILDNVTVCNTRIDSAAAFTDTLSTDCLYRGLKITDNLLLMQDTASLNISGVLSGGEFRGNKFSSIGESHPCITLCPGRIGRDLAEDGMLHILSFTADSEWQYGEFIAADNRLQASNERVAIRVEDARAVLPAQLSHCAAGLVDFDYQAFYRQYTGWTVRDFQARDSIGYTRLQDWLERREEEYRSGVRTDAALLPPTRTQCALGANTLIDSLAQARSAMSRNQADFRALRLTELPYLPLRNFIMKRIAVRNAELAPLTDLGEKNAYRRACLQFLLPARAFSHLANTKALSAAHTNDPVAGGATGHYAQVVEPVAEGIV